MMAILRILSIEGRLSRSGGREHYDRRESSQTGATGARKSKLPGLAAAQYLRRVIRTNRYICDAIARETQLKKRTRAKKIMPVARSIYHVERSRDSCVVNRISYADHR